MAEQSEVLTDAQRAAELLEAERSQFGPDADVAVIDYACVKPGVEVLTYRHRREYLRSARSLPRVVVTTRVAVFEPGRAASVGLRASVGMIIGVEEG